MHAKPRPHLLFLALSLALAVPAGALAQGGGAAASTPDVVVGGEAGTLSGQVREGAGGVYLAGAVVRVDGR